MQGSWGAKDVFNEFAEDYVKRVNEMAGGRLKIDYLIGGAVVHPFQVFDGVHGGQLDAAHTVTVYWYGKHKAASLFGTGPVFGFNANEGLGWIHNGGGSELFDELQTQIMKVNIISFFAMPMPTQPLGWFKKPIKSAGRPEGPEVPHRRPGRRPVPGHGRLGGAASGRRDRAGHGARRDRRLRVQQPDLRPPLRRPGRGQELHAGQPPSGHRVLRDHVQPHQVQRAAQGAAGHPPVRRRGVLLRQRVEGHGLLLEGPAGADRPRTRSTSSARPRTCSRLRSRPGTA